VSGCCVRSSFFLVVSFFGLTVWSQVKENPNKAIKAVIVTEEAYVLKEPDFDAKVITILPGGNKVYFVSKGKWGPFHKIRVSPKIFGYVLDADIKTFAGKKTPSQLARQQEAQKPKRSIIATQFGGPVLQITNFTEDTMGKKRSQMLSMLGYKWSGFNSFFDGGVYTDSNLLMYWGAPGYYKDATGHGSSGYNFIGDFLLEYTQLQSRESMSFFGFGGMMRLSHFDVTLTEGATDVDYSMDDMVVGLAFNAGVAARIAEYALRFDAKYYWEKEKYWALGLAFQW
jgi:hypothetical protein